MVLFDVSFLKDENMKCSHTYPLGLCQRILDEIEVYWKTLSYVVLGMHPLSL